MTSIGWLHISDLHTTLRRPGWTAASIQQAVFADLARLHDRAGPWDVVIVAGDLSMRGSPEELDEAGSSLDRLLAYLHKLGSDPCLLAVPGNHDLVRTEGAVTAHRTLRRWHDDPTVQEEFWNDPESPSRRLVDRAFEPFERWWRDRARDAKTVKHLHHGLLPGDFTATIEKDDVRFGIAGLCSAFLQVTGDDYEGRLGLSPHQLLIAAGGDVPAWVARHDATILVTHHAPAWLAPDARQGYEAEINPAGRFCAHLSGHLHEAVPLVEGEKRLQIRSPSFFGINAWEDRRGRAMARQCGYVAARLDLDNPVSGWLRVFAGTWDHKTQTLRSALEYDNKVARFPRLSDDAPTSFLPERAALRDALVAVYPAPYEARRLGRKAGLRLGNGALDGSTADVWHRVVSEADGKGKLSELVRIARIDEHQDDPRLIDAWSVYDRATRPTVPVAAVRRGSVEERRADELYEQLLQLDPAAFRAVMLILGVENEIPGDSASPATRAMALVRRMERDGRPGLARLEAAIVHVSRPSTETSTAGATNGTSSTNWLGVIAVLAAGTALLSALSEPPKRRARRVRAPTEPSLTKLLTLMFADERDFDGFVLDHFPAVYRKFTSGMNRDRRVRILLDAVAATDVVARLKRAYPSTFAAHQRVLDYDDPA